MNWPIEYDERVRAKGFSILDDDFDSMARDLAKIMGEDRQRKKSTGLYTSVRKIAKNYWLRSMRLRVA